MKPRLADFLSCPACQVALQLEPTSCQGDEIVVGKLRCAKCGAEFPIRDGIPRFVPGDAYVTSFSFEWKRWRLTQFDTAEHRASETTFIASTGKHPEELAGKLVLDAGCGAGRYMDVVARGGGEVVGVDLSFSVDAARDNLRMLPNCHLVQADVLHLPFRPAAFDFVYSLGVLEHTPDTRASFLSLLRTPKPGGEVAIFVFPRHRLAETFRYFPARVNDVLTHDVNFRIPRRLEGLVRRLAPLLDWTMETSSNLGRAFTTRLPRRWLYWLCHAAIPLYYLYRIPLFYPLRLVTRIAMDPNPERRVLDTFDWYSPRYKWTHSFTEVRTWFEEAGLEQVTLLPRAVAVRGRKPSSREETRSPGSS